MLGELSSPSKVFRLKEGYADPVSDEQTEKAWKHLCKRSHHLHCRIVNETDYDIACYAGLEGDKTDNGIVHDSTFFAFGSLVIAPPEFILPHTTVTFGVGGEHGVVVGGGVSGGMAFRVVLDGEKESELSFAVGFSDPIVGHRKVGVRFSTNPEEGYNSATCEDRSEEVITDLNNGIRVAADIDGGAKKATYTVTRI